MSSQKLNLKSYQYELHGKNKIPRLTLVWSNSEETTSQVLCAISRITGPFSHDCSWLWYSVYKISFRTKNMSQLARWFQRENSILEFLKKSSDIHTRRITWLLVFTQELTVFTPVDVVLFRRVNSLQVDVSYLLSLPSAFGKWYVTGGLVLRSLPRFYPWLHGDLWMKLRNWTVVQLCSSFHN